MWLSEVYRLVTTYDILTKAGYKPDSAETNRALICILSESFYLNPTGRIGDSEKAVKFVSSAMGDQESQTPAKKEGMKLARKLLLATWDSVLEILGLPLDTSTKIIGMSCFDLFVFLYSLHSNEHHFIHSLQKELKYVGSSKVSPARLFLATRYLDNMKF